MPARRFDNREWFGSGNTCVSAPPLPAEEQAKVDKAIEIISDKLLSDLITEEGRYNEEVVRRYNTTVKNPAFKNSIRVGILNNDERIHFDVEPRRTTNPVSVARRTDRVTPIRNSTWNNNQTNTANSDYILSEGFGALARLF
jgi:hypothetical protein